MTRRVAVFGLGGTIAMTSGSGGVTPTLSAADLLDAVPGLAATGIAVSVTDFRRVPGASLTFDDLTALAAAIRDTPADGVVVIQGTDTIEETAYLLDLGHHDHRPLVVTGAMRNPTMAGADGPANLLAAVTVAASPQARDLGALVVLADEIHAAARVRKTHSSAGSTFRSDIGGPLGYVIEGRVRIVNRPTVRLVLPEPTGNPNVGLVTMTLGDSGTALTNGHDGYDGLVVAGFGVGHVPAHLVDRLAELAATIPVVLASRTGAGSVFTETYAFPGSETDLVAKGLIPAGLLDPLKARILLRQLLAAESDDTAIRAAFDQ